MFTRKRRLPKSAETITFFQERVSPEIFAPKPADKNIPDWYRLSDSYVGGKKEPANLGPNVGETRATIKRCMPVFDSLTTGYIMYTDSDLYVTNRPDGLKDYAWSGDFFAFHPKLQLQQYPVNRPQDPAVLKFNNPYAIQTPKGYSCLFVSPFSGETPFQIIPGIVDTDTYHAAVFFPLTFKDPNFEGKVLAGTPIAQVIPFKRDSWEMKITDEKHLSDNTHTYLRSAIYDKYKRFFWKPKSYS
jgi:hypothetical protein